MGARGPLKIVSAIQPVADATSGTVAAEVPALAPLKPEAVVDDETLSALWDLIVPGLDAAGLVSPSDGPAVELCLRHFRAARDASDHLASGKPTVWDAKNERPMKNPSEVVFRSESLAFLEYAKQLGMTFVSRARTPAATKGADDGGNPFASGVG